MNNTNTEVSQGEYFDPITGEIIELEPDRITLEELPKIGNWINSTNRKIEHLKSPKSDCTCADCNLSRQLTKLQELVTKKITDYCDRTDYLTDRARQLIDTTGKDKIVYPGTGTFRYRKMPLSLVIDDGAEIPEEFINKQVTETPNKKLIKEFLKEGNIIFGCSFNTPEPKFEFKED